MGLTTSNPVIIGIVDSGCGFARSAKTGVEQVIAAQGFKYDQGVVLTPASDDQLGHGSALLEVMAIQAPTASFAIAQIFHERLSTTPAQVPPPSIGWWSRRLILSI